MSSNLLHFALRMSRNSYLCSYRPIRSQTCIVCYAYGHVATYIVVFIAIPGSDKARDSTGAQRTHRGTVEHYGEVQRSVQGLVDERSRGYPNELHKGGI